MMMKSKKRSGIAPTEVQKPFQAQFPKSRKLGAWRDHIEQAMDDARAMGSGSRVVSKNGIVLARFENSMKHSDFVKAERAEHDKRSAMRSADERAVRP